MAATGQGVDPVEAQEAARRILSERRFRSPDVPRPLHGFLEGIGGTLRRAWEGFFGFLDELLPGPEAAVWTVLAATVVVAALAFAAHLSRRRTVALFDPRAQRDAAGVDAREIERRADEAERAGDFAAAVRLRFRAGLSRLAAKGAVPWTESTPTRQVARKLRSPRFDGLAATFDHIVYGGRAATAADAETARAEWSSLLADAGAGRVR